MAKWTQPISGALSVSYYSVGGWVWGWVVGGLVDSAHLLYLLSSSQRPLGPQRNLTSLTFQVTSLSQPQLTIHEHIL